MNYITSPDVQKQVGAYLATNGKGAVHADRLADPVGHAVRG